MRISQCRSSGVSLSSSARSCANASGTMSSCTNFLVIDPDECIDCAVCIPECPVNAILPEEDVPNDQLDFVNTCKNSVHIDDFYGLIGKIVMPPQDRHGPPLRHRKSEAGFVFGCNRLADGVGQHRKPVGQEVFQIQSVRSGHCCGAHCKWFQLKL